MSDLDSHIVYSPASFADIGPHVFPMEKYAGVVRRLREEDGLEDPVEPEPASREALLRVHDEAYLEDLDEGVHTPRTLPSELPISGEIVDFFVLACGGTTRAARIALRRRWAAHVGGGFHHAFAGKAEGFCYLNDLAVAAATLLEEGAVERVTVIDVDVHQGNGTAAIFAGDDRVFTMSIHQEDNYPIKERGDLDVGLVSWDRSRAGSPWVEDEAYLESLAPAVERSLEHDPELVLVQCGADPYRDDQLGGLRLTLEGLKRRDETVFRACAERRIPWVVTFGGGYAFDVADTVAIHLQTIRTARDVAEEAWGRGGSSEATPS
ncbi:MAG: histone deacetylase [Gemmatimonadota bacterium]|nr:histone deacetylase [Gemmatimonadota bacterium]